MATYIVTVTSADRVGIVHVVTGALRDQGGNIIELSQTVMRGYFTIILAVEFAEPQNVEKLRTMIAYQGRQFELTVAVIEARPGDVIEPVKGERFILTVLGDDHPGNIHGIAGSLAARGVNIVDLHARTDGDRFSMVMEAFLPTDLSPVELKADLERFGKSLGLEAFVQHENIFLATSEPSPVRVSSVRSTSPSLEGAADASH